MNSVIQTIGRGFAWNTASIFIGKVIILFNVFIILNHLSVYDYGLTELVFSAVSMAGIFTLSGLTQIITVDLGVELAQGRLGRLKGIFHQHLMLNVLLGIAVWAVFFFGADPVAGFVGNPFIAPLLQIVSFLFLIAPLRVASQMLAMVSLRYADQSFYGVVEEIWKSVFLAILLILLGLGPTGLLLAAVFSQLAAVITFMPRTLSAYRAFSSAIVEDSSAFWNILRNHRKWGIASSYVNTLIPNFRTWVIKGLLGTEAVGLFAFAYGIFSNLIALIPLSTVLTPLFPKVVHQKERLARIVRTSIKVQFTLVFLAFLVAIAGAYLFVSMLFPKFLPAVSLLYVIFFAMLPNSVVTIFTPVFAALKEQRSLFLASLFKASLTLLLLAPLILMFGVIGAALEVVVTTLASSIERYMRMKRILVNFRLSLRGFITVDAREKEIIRGLIRRPSLRSIRSLLLESDDILV